MPDRVGFKKVLVSKWAQFQDPTLYHGKYKEAFFKAMAEYNQFGIAAVHSRFQVDTNTQMQLYGFKVAWLTLCRLQVTHQIIQLQWVIVI